MIDFGMILVIAIVIFAMFLFIKEVFPIDITALIIMSILMLTHLISPEEGVSGFSNEAVLTILAMFILSAGIEKTGLIHTLSIKIFGLTGSSQFLQLLFIMIMVAPFSAIMNNAPIVAVMIPFVLSLTKMSKTSPSKLLIPLSFVSMAAGNLTLIGTSTNLLANSIITRTGMAPFGIFSFWKIGLYITGIVVLYFLTIGYWILPKKSNKKLEYENSGLPFTFEIEIIEKSKLIGEKIKSTILRKKYDLRILSLHREKKKWKENFSNRVLQLGDILTIESSRETLMNLEEETGVKILVEDFQIDPTKNEVLNMVIPHGSHYIGKKIEDLDLRKKYGALIVGIRKGALRITKRLEKIKLNLGDLILLKTTKEDARKIKNDRNLMLVEKIETNYRKDKKLTAILIVVGAVLFAALGIYPILVTAFVGVILMVLTGVLSPKEAYSSVRWEVIFLLAGLIPLGIALEKSGTAAFIAKLLSSFAGNYSHYTVMVGFFIFTTVLTEILSNNASAILLVPIGLDLAKQININPYMMTLVIMMAASTSYLTPIGYKTNTMIYGTGVYKFSDFFKVGALLNLILAFVTPYLILKFWTGI